MGQRSSKASAGTKDQKQKKQTGKKMQKILQDPVVVAALNAANGESGSLKRLSGRNSVIALPPPSPASQRHDGFQSDGYHSNDSTESVTLRKKSFQCHLDGDVILPLRPESLTLFDMDFSGTTPSPDRAAQSRPASIPEQPAAAAPAPASAPAPAAVPAPAAAPATKPASATAARPPAITVTIADDTDYGFGEETPSPTKRPQALDVSTTLEDMLALAGLDESSSSTAVTPTTKGTFDFGVSFDLGLDLRFLNTLDAPTPARPHVSVSAAHKPVLNLQPAAAGGMKWLDDVQSIIAAAREALETDTDGFPEPVAAY